MTICTVSINMCCLSGHVILITRYDLVFVFTSGINKHSLYLDTVIRSQIKNKLKEKEN